MGEHIPGLVCPASVCYTLACKHQSINARRVAGGVRFGADRGAWHALGEEPPNGERAIPGRRGNIAVPGSADSVPSGPRSGTADDGSREVRAECEKRGSVARNGSPRATLSLTSSPMSEGETRAAVCTAATLYVTSD